MITKYPLRSMAASDSSGPAAYRLFTLFAPMPAAFVSLPKLRALGERGEGSTGKGTSTSKGEPALQH